MRTLIPWVFACAFLWAGCGTKPYGTAVVSGRITLDGKPLAGARVTFHPIHDPQSRSQSGPEAFGDTDAEGRYTLSTAFGDRGATVGPNRVTVSTLKVEPNPTNPDAFRAVAPERIPSKYFTERGMLKFDVPATGSQSADFDLTSK
jgi:hypothetical protein